jgi:hypothetical protein
MLSFFMYFGKEREKKKKKKANPQGNKITKDTHFALFFFLKKRKKKKENAHELYKISSVCVYVLRP